MTTIASRLQATQDSITAALTKAGRCPNLPTQSAPTALSLIAVSKAQSASAIRAAYQAGQRRFGENYLQEALDKQAELADLAIEWHFIGPIQSNKTQAIAANFAWVHGVDRVKIAQRLNDARPAWLPPLQLCIQVNVSAEASKSGIAPQQVAELAIAIRAMPRLTLRGLMAIPAPTADQALQHSQFSQVRQILEQRNQQGDALDTLSMGMSDDFAIAIAEGATMVRIGSAIFGARSKAPTLGS